MARACYEVAGVCRAAVDNLRDGVRDQHVRQSALLADATAQRDSPLAVLPVAVGRVNSRHDFALVREAIDVFDDARFPSVEDVRYFFGDVRGRGFGPFNYVR